MLPLLQLLATVVSTIVVWGFTTGKFVQRRADAERNLVHDVEVLNLSVGKKADADTLRRLEVLVSEMHQTVIQMDIRIARIEERQQEATRRLDLMERRVTGWFGGRGAS